jgi:CheY-specific phosphatase CheX
MDLENLHELDQFPDEITQLVKKSVTDTLESIIGEELTYNDEQEEAEKLNGMVGNITIFNSNHTLSLILAIPKDSAIFLSEVFIGMEIPFESEDMGDLIGEVSNIVAGEVAANIETIGFRGQSSLPTATRGSDLTLFMPNKPPTKKMKFEGDSIEFWLTMALSESQ